METDQHFNSGVATSWLSFPVAPEGGYRILLQSGDYLQSAPLAVEVVDVEGAASWLVGTYMRVVVEEGAFAVTGNLPAPGEPCSISPIISG